MLSEVTVSEFAGHLGSSFRLQTDAGATVKVELVEATALSAHNPTGQTTPRREPFSLLFRGPSEPVLPQMIHTLEHPALGRFELFLVPIGPDGNGMRYEAVFN